MPSRRPQIIALFVLLTLGLIACTSSDQKTANEHAAEAERKLDNAADLARHEAAQAGKKIDKATLVARVKAALAMDTGLRSMESVQVAVSGDGNIELHGTVRSDNEKKEVEQAALHVDGVAHVVNDLRVQP